MNALFGRCLHKQRRLSLYVCRLCMVANKIFGQRRRSEVTSLGTIRRAPHAGVAHRSDMTMSWKSTGVAPASGISTRSSFGNCPGNIREIGSRESKARTPKTSGTMEVSKFTTPPEMTDRQGPPGRYHWKISCCSNRPHISAPARHKMNHPSRL